MMGKETTLYRFEVPFLQKFEKTQHSIHFVWNIADCSPETIKVEFQICAPQVRRL